MGAGMSELDTIRQQRDELLAALTELLRCNETRAGDNIVTWSNAMLAARTAIAKAKGGAA